MRINLPHSFVITVVVAGTALCAYRQRTASENDSTFIPNGRAATLQDQDATPRALRTFPLDGYCISTDGRLTLLRHATRWCRIKGTSNGVLIHALRLRPLAHAVRPEIDSAFYDAVLDHFLDNARYHASAPDEQPLLFDTQFGAVYRTNNVNSTGRPYAGGLMHVDKVLSCLAEQGIPLSTEVITASGRSRRLADVLEDSLRRWTAERESEWSLVAYCDYLRAQNTWLSGDGRVRTLNDVLEAVLRRPPPGTCAGTHRLYALAKSCALSREVPGSFSADLIRQAELALCDSSRQLTITQRQDGAWPEDWRIPSDPLAAAKHSDATPYVLMATTGHMLEWFAISPPDLRPPGPVVEKAARYVENELLANPEIHFGGPRLTAVTHAVRGLLHLCSPCGEPFGMPVSKQ